MNIERWLPFVIALFLIIGCTEKNNPVGYQDQDINQDTISVNLSDYNLQFYTSQDSSANYTENPTLTLGSYTYENQISKAVILLKFPEIPDSIISVQNVNLDIHPKKGNYDNFNFEIGKLNKDWVENEATYNNATSDSTWIIADNFESIITQSVAFADSDSVVIDLPDITEILQEWAEGENYGFILQSEETDKFVELYSSENYESEFLSYRPRLSFDYYSETDSLYSYDEYVAYDVSIFDHPDNIEIIPDKMILSNNHIKRPVMKFDLPIDKFIENPDITDSAAVQTVIINKAELILTKKTDYYFNSDEEWKLYPYILMKENPDEPMTISEDYEFVSNSVLTDEDFEDNQISINVSAIIQALLAKEKSNYGITIKSIRENKDFGFVEFEPNIELKIIYSNPNDF